LATIKIDLDRVIGAVDRRIFGGFVEHLGRCIYGGIYDEGSPLSDADGFRQDVLEAARALRMPLLRWPGGNFVSGYHWQDGIGPKDRRPRRIELAWHGEESNRFGTDEFIQYCRTLGTEPYICVNLGTGTIDEAQAWVEYCNGTGNTYWANLRRENGHPEPYGVRYWGLGNEMYGQWQLGALPSDEYTRKAVEFAKVMKLTDPAIQLVSCGQNGWQDWDRIVLEGLAPYVDYHSIHLYTGSSDYDQNVFAPHQAERAIKICQALIDQVRYNQQISHPIAIAYDEWNVWYRARGAESRLEERYDLADALAVATYLNIFVRHCPSVKVANLAQLVNVIAPIFSSPLGLYLQTIYHPLRLIAEHTRALALDVFVDSPTASLPAEPAGAGRLTRIADLGPFKLLDVAATGDETRRELTLVVVNRHRSDAIPATIRLTDGVFGPEVRVSEVNGPDVGSTNSFEQPNLVGVAERVLPAQGSDLEYRFPAHSVSVLRWVRGLGG
jgi:alpha-N-arabinofuranosidase